MTTDRILLTTDAVGGVWTYSVDLAGALARSGTEVVLVTLGPAPNPAQRAAVERIAGVTLVACDAPLDWLAPGPSAVREGGNRIAALAAEHRVGVVQLHAPALCAGVAFPVPVVAVVHSCLATWWDAIETSALPDDFAWRNALTRSGMIAADAVVAPSLALAEALQRVHHLPFTPRVVHNGRAAHTRRPGPLADHAFTAGRLWDRGKDVVTLDRAAALADVPIVAAGPATAPDGATIGFEALAWRGVLDPAELVAELSSRPVYASAALYEPFGLAVLEAAQAGCALVLSDIATFRELWDGVATFVEPRDAAGFGSAIAALLADPVARSARGKAARRRAARYSDDAMAAGMRAIYATLAGGAGGRVAA